MSGRNRLRRARREGWVVELVGLADQSMGKFARHVGGFPVGQAMLGDEACEKGAIDPPRDVVPRRDRQKGARVVVEADRVVETGGLGRHLAEAAHRSAERRVGKEVVSTCRSRGAPYT